MRKKFLLEEIHKKIASIGHDTKLETANEEAYGKLAVIFVNIETKKL